MNSFVIHHGDALDVLRGMANNSVDAIVTDPPYGLGKEPNAAEVLTDWVTKGFHEVKASGGFMGKKWDSFVPQPLLWKEVFRVLKPGGHLLSFAGTRTYDWMVMSLRLAGFEIRDMINWVYGSGFPKSTNISKQIDKAAGVEREVIATRKLEGNGRTMKGGNFHQPEGEDDRQGRMDIYNITAPATEAAKQWDGFGTALKPAHEPIVLARKPLSESSITANVLRWGTGAVNVDGCRVETTDSGARNHGGKVYENVADGYKRLNKSSYTHKTDWAMPSSGRFPANLITDGSAGVVAMFPQSSAKNGVTEGHSEGGIWAKSTGRRAGPTHGDNGSAARFFKACPPDDAASMFYCAKASRSERDAGLDGMEAKHVRRDDGQPYGMNTNTHRPDGSERKPVEPKSNFHPCVKPQSLMRYLCRLITPPNGVILDPFFGSGSTGVAALTEGFSIIGIEQDAEFAEIARHRCEHAKPEATTEVELPPLLAVCEAAA